MHLPRRGMPSRRNILAFVAGVVVVADGPNAAAGAAEPADSWTTLLQLQLKDSYSCDIERVLYSRHVAIGKDIGTEGRLRCLDRREYDFTRSRQHQKFTIRLCQPTVC